MSENQDAGQMRKVGIMMDGAMVLSKLREMNFSVFFFFDYCRKVFVWKCV